MTLEQVMTRYPIHPFHHSLEKPAGISDSLRPDDVNPHLVFHYGIPSGSKLLAYDSIQQILAISTMDGQIKLFGKDGSQALLESVETVASKFLLIWDIDRKCLSAVHHFEKDITSFAAMRKGSYLYWMYVGDSDGDVSVLRLHQDQRHIERMNYYIPLSASHGKTNEVGNDIAVQYILPQPAAETKRVLIIFSDGVITLWAIRESKAIFASTGGTTLQSMHQEAKKVTAACWACPAGTKVVVGYSSGDIILWSVPCPPDPKTEQPSQNELSASQITPISKLNLGYKAEKIPIAKLKWVYADGKSSRLYVLGCSNHHSANSLQVVLLNECTETRTIKLGLQLPESVVDLEITTSSVEQNKHRQDSLLLLGRSSHLYVYDDSFIERYLVQCQTKSPPSLPKEVIVKLPYGDSSITISKFITSTPCMPCSANEDFNMLSKNNLPLFPFEKDIVLGQLTSGMHLAHFCFPVASITQQSDNDFSVSGIPLTALYFSYDSHILVSGIKVERYNSYPDKFVETQLERAFRFQSCKEIHLKCFYAGSSKKGSNHIIRRIKVVKVNGAVLSINTAETLKQLAVGSDQGYVSLIDPEGPSVLYQTHIASELCTGIISMHFETCSFHGFEKNVMIVATKDSSVLALERDTGNILSSGTVHPSKPSRALFTQILGRGSTVPDGTDINNINSDNSLPKQSFLLQCSEKAVYVYSLLHLVQGVKKVLYKKKFNSSCYWASTFGSPDVAVILLFASGKVEIRLMAIRNYFLSQLCFTRRLTDVWTLFPKFLNKDLVTAQGLISSFSTREKKKGIFSSVIKDNDIDIEDPKDKPRGYPVLAGLNRQNFTNTFQAIKGKLKHVKVKNDKVPINDEQQQDEKTGAVDQIKKKYGYASSGESSAANTAKNKLSENLRKLQGISLKTTEMQDTARSFSSMAKEVLRFAENEKKGS
ncbi:hypothetical protein Sango_1861000 [Sesamum angolense]|uniref:Lethal giant larvae (Lgl)-like C-terminal domain-containing protein n=1 Tax=Sesamum angolense TaxID=2727404 RepID=A0AAE2BQB3_9LAMI|nr:hypothetical protein Sango_1861000 [Sesamum angolense]